MDNDPPLTSPLLKSKEKKKKRLTLVGDPSTHDQNRPSILTPTRRIQPPNTLFSRCVRAIKDDCLCWLLFVVEKDNIPQFYSRRLSENKEFGTSE